jgi:hypothetical protein
MLDTIIERGNSVSSDVTEWDDDIYFSDNNYYDDDYSSSLIMDYNDPTNPVELEGEFFEALMAFCVEAA